MSSDFRYSKEEVKAKIIITNFILLLSKVLLWLVILFHIFVLYRFFISNQDFFIKLENLFLSFSTIISCLMFFLPVVSLIFFSKVKKKLINKNNSY